ncbi:flagellar protein FlgN [Alteromonas sediminis]|uniref:Flagellar protein FlgN n=1 Tax=Alteromonas sediminis TaxID=2259342 RepID=A0A3N5Y8Y1_9ALTE|nr:flagellar export chaperone FlgN [Alteromonas sediminis]RPJ64945.1 flagellar protein FlgN [Alteromonas sediminis]
MSELSGLFETQCEQLNNLLMLLDRELHLISAREPDELMRLVEEKNQLLDAIQKLDGDIAAYYAEHMTGDNKASLSDDEQRLLDENSRLLEQCKYNTSINEKAVEQGQLKLAHLRQLIMDVRAKESLTYDKSGATKGGTLGKGVSA